MRGQAYPDVALSSNMITRYSLMASLLLAAGLSVVMNNLLAFFLATTLFVLLTGVRRAVQGGNTEVYLAVTLLIYLSLVLEPLLTMLDLRPVWLLVSQTLSGLIIGGVGLLLVLILVREDFHIDRTDVPLIALFAFTFGVALGSLWELSEFFLGGWLSGVQGDINDTMTDLGGVAIGSAFVSLAALAHMKSYRIPVFSQALDSIRKANPDLFSSAGDPEMMASLIAKGEGEQVEFKSSLRTNLKTGEADKRLEHAVLKTVAAFLNSDGGVLLIGVADDGAILGIDLQHLDNPDKFFRHLTGLLGNHIGERFLPFIDCRLVNVGDRRVMMIKCSPSDAPAYLTFGGKEEFFVRSGASSIELTGREMVGYIRNRFD